MILINIVAIQRLCILQVKEASILVTLVAPWEEEYSNDFISIKDYR